MISTLLVVMYSVHTLRVARFDREGAVSIAHEQPLQLLVAWVPQILVTVSKVSVPRLVAFMAAAASVSFSYRRPRRLRDRLLATVVVVGATVGLNVEWEGPIWRTLPALCLGAVIIWRPDRWKSGTPHEALKNCGFCLLAGMIWAIVWASDEPWAQPELIWVSDAKGNRGTNMYCTGWVLGEQANGRWLIVLLEPSRSVVPIETSTIWARVSFSQAEAHRFADRESTKEQVIFGPTGEVVARDTDEETLAGKPNCPMSLVDSQGLIDKLRQAQLATTTTTSTVQGRVSA